MFCARLMSVKLGKPGTPTEIKYEGMTSLEWIRSKQPDINAVTHGSAREDVMSLCIQTPSLSKPTKKPRPEMLGLVIHEV
jgi:hypothetical protein